MVNRLIRILIKLIIHAIVILLSKILLYNNLRWSAIDLHYPANSQNCQIVQDGPAYNQLILLNINYY